MYIYCISVETNIHNTKVFETFCGHTGQTVTQLCQSNKNGINVGSLSADGTNPIGRSDRHGRRLCRSTVNVYICIYKTHSASGFFGIP